VGRRLAARQPASAGATGALSARPDAASSERRTSLCHLAGPPDRQAGSGRPGLAALLARISTDDQFQFGIRTSWPASKPSNRNVAMLRNRRPPQTAAACLGRDAADAAVPTLGDDVVGI
jgi:hypothetical protein